MSAIDSAAVLRRIRAYAALNGTNGDWDIEMLERVVLLAGMSGIMPEYRPSLWRSWIESCLGKIPEEDIVALLGSDG